MAKLDIYFDEDNNEVLLGARLDDEYPLATDELLKEHDVAVVAVICRPEAALPLARAVRTLVHDDVWGQFAEAGKGGKLTWGGKFRPHNLEDGRVALAWVDTTEDGAHEPGLHLLEFDAPPPA